MIDRWAMKMVRQPLGLGAMLLHRRNITATQISVVGFFLGMLTVPLLYMHWYGAALVCILLNRIADGLDGNVARLTTPTDAGGYLDITFDFIFYSAVVFGFALADPVNNGLAAAALIFAFIGTGSSFLAFGIMAERRQISNFRYPNKGFYYLDGIAEGTETLLFLVLFCLFPHHFTILAWIFAVICYLSTLIRLISGHNTLSS
ncbi:MAG: CDP-alcohol phosphatidyltransferase family protein [Desulfocapsaceae bacterium]|nr:CDP-alcohol phosphatidyltransferase family protein [Desulfocapsaceae bacterium]